MLAKMLPDRLKMHQKAFGGRAPPGPAGELYRSPDSLAVIRRREGGKGKERVGNSREGMKGMKRKDVKG